MNNILLQKIRNIYFPETMYVIPSVSSMTPEELRHKRKALRDAIVCVGWIKIEKISALELAAWLCITVAAYNTILSLVGGIFFIRTGFLLIHFLMAIMFALLSVSVFTVLCHDIIVIYTFKTLSKSPSTLTQPVETIIPPPNILIKNVNNKPPWP
ncbi:hypothetical protein HF086_013719 [Spodoptera exigua]|uniref:Uncharacterized protein n=1 Tax=Spodoptera exigua TaxID=7107 RepID=A0A922SFQ5_SPOEX|nr:hypothetical protein HF086_013719 [Spodoptera exigua]